MYSVLNNLNLERSIKKIFQNYVITF